MNINKTRLEQLQKFLEDEPTDPFNIYALALEYQKLDSSKALNLFKQLVTEHESYLPTYYHLGKLHEELGERQQALEILTKGIIQARNQKDLKALRELQAAYNEIEFE
jgi:tetratricopeptide (TPR) repeat protein